MATAAQLLLASGFGMQGQLLNATRAVSPLFSAIDAYELMGTYYESLALVSLPTASGFKNLGEGAVASSAQYARSRVDCARIYTNVSEEKSTTDKWNQDMASMISSGQALDWVTTQLRTRLMVEAQNVDKQIVLGTANDAKGFIGLRDSVNCASAANVLAMTTSANADNYVRSALNVGGSTATTGSRVYLMSMGLDAVCLRFGGPQGMAGFLSPAQVTENLDTYTDPIDSILKQRRIYYTDAEGYVGLSIFGESRGTSRVYTQRVLRVAFNVTAQAGYTCTETVLDRLLNSMPPESRSSLVFAMSNRSRNQLRDSKTANGQVSINIGPGDASMRTFTTIPDLPDSHRGIPIIESDWISDTDSIVTPA